MFCNVDYIRNMLTYTDAKVRAVIRVWMGSASHSYRSAAIILDVDPASFYRMAHGQRPISEEVAKAMGFEPLAEPKRWIRWQDAKRQERQP